MEGLGSLVARVSQKGLSFDSSELLSQHEVMRRSSRDPILSVYLNRFAHMTDAPPAEPDIAVPHRGRGRPKDETVTLTKAARVRFDTLAAESIEAVFQAVLTAATQDG